MTTELGFVWQQFRLILGWTYLQKKNNVHANTFFELKKGDTRFISVALNLNKAHLLARKLQVP